MDVIADPITLKTLVSLAAHILLGPYHLLMFSGLFII